MKHRTGLAAGALALALTFAGTGSASAAAVMVYTYKGTVNSVSESGGGNLFGAIIPHQTSFTAVFTRNDNAPGATQLAGGDPDAAFSQLYGDQTTSPVLARLEVGGLIFNIGSTPGFPTHSGGQSQRKFSDGYEDFGISSTDFSISSSGCCEFIKRKSIQFYASGTGGDYLANADYHSLDTLTSAETPLLNWQGSASFDDYYYDSAR
eukprot:gene21484-41549_t